MSGCFYLVSLFFKQECQGCFTDYEFPASVPSHASAADVQRYLESYAKHFDLEKRCRLGVSVQKVRFEEAEQKWILEMADGTSPRFDKVVVSTGPTSHPNMPKIPGVERFEGDYIHSQAFKRCSISREAFLNMHLTDYPRPELFKGKRVLLVGLGNTTADTVEELRGHASEIYISHAKGIHIVSCHPQRKRHRVVAIILHVSMLTTCSFRERAKPVRLQTTP